MRLVYCERSSRRGLLLWNGGCVSFLCISEVNGVFFLEQRFSLQQEWSNGSLHVYLSDTLVDMRIEDIETPKEK